MLYVSRFSNPVLKSGDYTAVRISLGAPKWPLGYNIAGEIKELMPFGLLQINDQALYEKRYRDRLNRIGHDRIQEVLDSFGVDKPVVLLCYEDIRDPSQWCHRTMFAQWWLEQTGEIADELPDPSEVKLKHPQRAAKAAAAKAAMPSHKAAMEKAQERMRQREADEMQMRMF